MCVTCAAQRDTVGEGEPQCGVVGKPLDVMGHDSPPFVPARPARPLVPAIDGCPPLSIRVQSANPGVFVRHPAIPERVTGASEIVLRSAGVRAELRRVLSIRGHPELHPTRLADNRVLGLGCGMRVSSASDIDLPPRLVAGTVTEVSFVSSHLVGFTVFYLLTTCLAVHLEPSLLVVRTRRIVTRLAASTSGYSEFPAYSQI